MVIESTDQGVLRSAARTAVTISGDTQGTPGGTWDSLKPWETRWRDSNSIYSPIYSSRSYIITTSIASGFLSDTRHSRNRASRTWGLYHTGTKEPDLPVGSSLHVPDLAQERGELVVVHPPGHQHLGVVVVEGPQLREAPQQAGEVLRVLGLVNLAQLLQHVQQRLLELLHRLAVLYVLPVCRAVLRKGTKSGKH